MMLLGLFLIFITFSLFILQRGVRTPLEAALGYGFRTPKWLVYSRIFMLAFAMPVGIWLVVR